MSARTRVELRRGHCCVALNCLIAEVDGQHSIGRWMEPGSLTWRSDRQHPDQINVAELQIGASKCADQLRQQSERQWNTGGRNVEGCW
jgi:hypothetical protein